VTASRLSRNRHGTTSRLSCGAACRRDRQIAQLRAELQRARTDGLRGRKGILTRAEFNHLKAYPHPDSSGNFTDATLTKVRTKIESLEKVLVKISN
jgi:hypothetical protein